MKTMCNLVLISLCCYATVVATQDVKLIVPLNKTLTYDDRVLYEHYITLNGASTLQVSFSDVNKNISFIVFQVHSHIHEITINNSLETNSKVSGTNVGLVTFTEPKLDTFNVLNSNINVTTVFIYISVHGYTAKDPIPGGCNIDSKFPVPISPYLRTEVNKNYVTVEAAAPSKNRDDCSNGASVADYTFYMMYIPEMNFDADVYFDGIKNMMSIKNVKKNGWALPVQSSKWAMRRLVSAYPGLGTVYVVVAVSETGYSVYVPNITYACSPAIDGDCALIDDLLSQILCAILFFIGIFICYFGHRFFKTEMFLAGFFSGVMITYILIAIITVVDRPALAAASTLSGIFFGAIWLLFWWLYGIPVLAVLLPTMHLGFLLSAIFYYRLPGGLMIEDSHFWSTFVLIMLLTSLALVSVTFAANILCCSVLGAYASVYAFDYYMGSNLKYIMLNTIRRAVVPEFNWVLLAPPFQWRDTIMVLLWIALAATGFMFQHIHNRSRPPFPPPPRNTRLSVPEERMYGTLENQRSRRQPEANTGEADERTALLA